MRCAATLAPVVVVLGLLAAGCGRPAPADVVFLHGRIYTLAGAPPAQVEAEPVVEAMAVRAGRIVALGRDADMQRYAGRDTRVHDLHGATAVPGLVDSHLHMASLGRSLAEVDLVGTKSYAEVLERVSARAATNSPGSWITGRGWDQNDWEEAQFPDHAALSSRLPSQPVYLRRVDGHAVLVNGAALALAGITSTTPDPPGGRIEHRADGSPTGVLVDAAINLVSILVPPPDLAERRARLQAALAHCAALGLTGAHDAGVDSAAAGDYRALLAAGQLPLRIHAMWDIDTDAASTGILQAVLQAGPQPFDPTFHLALRAVKLYADGALGSRGAALLAPYADAPDQQGLPQYSASEFAVMAAPLHAAGFQIATHAIGDAANRMVLDAYAVLQRNASQPAARHRIEHAQVLAPADIPRFAALHVLPAMQPTHCTSDMPWAGSRLGAKRLRGAYAWRALRDTGVVIPAGSDAPVESVAPLRGIYAAVTRQDEHGQPQEGWQPEQRLTRSEALRAFTSWAAQASFTEPDLGTLEVGKLADLTVLDRDIVRGPAAELLATRVLQTVVGGEAIFP